jgi:histidinol-phosphatase (PHP family)
MSEPWKISLHGGHSGDFCAHGTDTLRGMLDAAVAFGYTTFGVTAHSQARDAKFLYKEEVEAGSGVGDMAENFRKYASTCTDLIDEYSSQLEVLLGAEIEVVPESTFAVDAVALKRDHKLDYLVGSVHWVDELPFDTNQDDFDKAVANRGGLEPFLLRYYELVGRMIVEVEPEVVGHLDLPRLFSEGAPELESAAVGVAVARVLENILAAGTIIDLNVGALSKPLALPYPAPWIVGMASEMGVPFCLGDDSHSIAQVGAGIAEGRDYLLGLGVDSITRLTRKNGDIVKEIVLLR